VVYRPPDQLQLPALQVEKEQARVAPDEQRTSPLRETDDFE
jgi:hypothetical protein